MGFYLHYTSWQFCHHHGIVQPPVGLLANAVLSLLPFGFQRRRSGKLRLDFFNRRQTCLKNSQAVSLKQFVFWFLTQLVSVFWTPLTMREKIRASARCCEAKIPQGPDMSKMGLMYLQHRLSLLKHRLLHNLQLEIFQRTILQG